MNAERQTQHFWDGTPLNPFQTHRDDCLGCSYERVVARLAAAEEALEELWRVIHDYGSHNHPCPWSHGDTLAECSCGFASALHQDGAA